MKRFILIAAFALLTGCAQLQALTEVAGTTVTPTQAIVAANAFDAAESGATAYLIYCKSNLQTPACSADNRRTVIKYTRSGRAGRNQMETYIETSASVPAVAYNVVVAAVNNLKTSPAASYVGAK